jgi:hypothetical protein
VASFDFPYTMKPDICPRCGNAGETVDGASLRAARVIRGVSLRWLAGRLGFSVPYLSDVESNRRRVTPKILQGYKTALGARRG